jgi:hypothetical protein
MSATITEAEPFHGWSFRLDGSADVDLTTSTLDEVDTVLYLYRATADGKKSGEYLDRNDDAGGAITSAIRKNLPGGSYFVQVKARKAGMLGTIGLQANCAGAGCPQGATSLEDHCSAADQAFDACMSGSPGSTEDDCAPSGVDAILCCNGSEARYCESVCDSAKLGLATIWDEDLSPVYDVFPDYYEGLSNATAYAVASCADPALDTLAALVLKAGGATSSPDAWQTTGWTTASAANPDAGPNLTPEVVGVVDGIVGAKATALWHGTLETPCPSCSQGVAKDILYYESIGKLIVLDSEWGDDS